MKSKRFKNPHSLWPCCKTAVLTILMTFTLTACQQQESGEPSAPAPDKAVESKITQPEQTQSANDYPVDVYFGDTHLHTSNSGDAFARGARLSVEDAYRFARGEAVTSTSGIEAKLSSPLDFLVVADHAEGLGVMQSLFDGDPELTKDPQLARWNEMMGQDPKQSQQAATEIIKALANNTLPAAISDPKKAARFAKGVWQEYLETAERFNDPGRFTALIGYEFTSQPKGDNMHRVVVFADDADKAGQILPFSSLMSVDPEDLWSFLQGYEQKTGGSALAIPHNSNLSNGRMFALADFEGNAIDSDYAERRARWEPLVEATQIKGDSEAHPFLSPNDEYASFGVSGWEQANLTLQTAKTNDMLAGDYVREGLKRGLLLKQQTGVNPFKFGMIGSTDSHTALATGAEDNFFGKSTSMEPSPKRATHIYKKTGIAEIAGWQYLAGGYAAVWATQNTRKALFDAMQRKEVYATTGSRIRLRFFGGFDFKQGMQDSGDIAQLGYKHGVPMGSDLLASDAATAPSDTTPGDSTPGFLVEALKDPQGRNLSQIQIIKGWVDSAGKLHEQVFDVSKSESDAGDAQLSAFWQDPNFNSDLDAFYYARILEVPGDRWPAFDADRFGIEIPDQARAQVRERAYSSPIWYQP